MSLSRFIMQLAPELILLIGACVVLMMGVTGSRGKGSRISLASLITLLLALVISLVQEPSGGFIPGLMLTPLTFYVRVIGLGIGTLILLVNWYQPAEEERGEYMSMLLFSLLGLLLTASANDLIVLFLAIELVSVPTYVLVGLSRRDHRAPEAAVKYFFLGAMAAALLAYGLSFLYGVGGSTSLYVVADERTISVLAGAFDGELAGYAVIGLLLVFAGLAFKVAAVPFHAYVPDVYEGAASPITGMLAFVPKFAGFIALVKVFGALNWDLPAAMQWMMWVVAAATMTVGNLLALLQKSAKRMLAYSSIAHTGYMLIALLVGPIEGAGPMKDGVAALMFYMAVYGAMNLGAFALLTSFSVGGKPMESLEELSGLAARAPLAAFALAVCVFSLMGFPPTAGFLGKLYIFSSAFSLGQAHSFQGPLIVLAVIGVVNSAIAAAYYLRIVAAVYMGQPRDDVRPAAGFAPRLSLAICSIAMLVLFIRPGILIKSAVRDTDVVLADATPPATEAVSPDLARTDPRPEGDPRP